MKAIKFEHLKSNGSFSIVKEPFKKQQHPNQQNGLDLYVEVLDHSTGNINTVKLYDSKRGMYFKKGNNVYLNEFTATFLHVPLQITRV